MHAQMNESGFSSNNNKLHAWPNPYICLTELLGGVATYVRGLQGFFKFAVYHFVVYCKDVCYDTRVLCRLTNLGRGELYCSE